MIIQSLAQQDFYKFTMKAAVFQHFPTAEAEYAFKCRTPNINLLPFKDQILDEILGFQTKEMDTSSEDLLCAIPYFGKAYKYFLGVARPNIFDVNVAEVDGALTIRVKGPWLFTIDWETWILAIVSAIYAEHQLNNVIRNPSYSIGYANLERKLNFLKNNAPDLKFVDMGFRRAACPAWHEQVLRTILHIHPSCLAGTSNVYLAAELNIPVFGTHAHEWDSAMLAFTHPLDAKRMAMQKWMDTFHGALGVCLTDTFTTDVFLQVFDQVFANAFSGVRHDSGPWDIWAKKILDHYRKLGIDPKTKTLVFSNGLNFEDMVTIYNALKDKCKVGFGIGTNLCNDCGFEPLNIVMKLVKLNGRPVLKLSDTPGKVTCENSVYLAGVRQVLGLG